MKNTLTVFALFVMLSLLGTAVLAVSGSLNLKCEDVTVDLTKDSTFKVGVSSTGTPAYTTGIVDVEFDEKGRPDPGTGYDFFYTEEHKEQLRRLFAQARAETRAQRVIFGMLQEEMEPYLKGQKDLESACEVLQSRAELYLKEQIR